LRLRAPTLDDLPELVEFFGEVEQHGSGGASEAELRDWLTSPAFDPALDFRIAWDDGRILGWCDVWDENKAHARFFVDLRVHPRATETYEALLGWAVERADELAGESWVVRAWGDSRDDVFAGVAQGRGFSLIRHFFRMEIDLTEDLPAPEWPDGISVRAYRPEDAVPVYEANADAFADHWDYVPLSFEVWDRVFLRSSEFDPALWFVAEEGEQIAGLALCRSERRPNIGHVNILGVRPPWRRRGLGQALLLHAFRELRARGRPKADLGVDAENTTGAVRLYERAGMHVVHRMDTYEKVFT
jgi:mycothiol synthase